MTSPRLALGRSNGLAAISAMLLVLAAPRRSGAEGGLEVAEETGITYAEHGGEALKLDLAEPRGDGAALRPAVLCIHGGGWRAGSREHYRSYLKELASEGFVAATVSYRFAPAHPWPAQRDDVRAALRWLIDNASRYRIDRERIAATGASAGGHLSLLLGLAPEQSGGRVLGVAAVVNYFGPTDMRSLRFPEVVIPMIRDLAGGEYEAKKKTYWDFSPVVHASPGDAAVLTFHGTEDELVPINQARLLHRELDRLRVPNRLEVLEGRRHGWGGADLESTQRQSREFLATYLKGSPHDLVAHEDFEGGAERWEPTDASGWKLGGDEGARHYSLFKKESSYKPAVRSPLSYALLRDVVVGDFVLDVKLRSTHPDYGHRDLVVVFAHQSPTRFYYAHLGKQADDHANSIFLVNDAARVSVARERSLATDWDDGWHRVRIRRDTASGLIDVFFDDMERPVMSTIDRTLLDGRIGVGSFDDTGDFDVVRLRGKLVKAGG